MAAMGVKRFFSPNRVGFNGNTLKVRGPGSTSGDGIDKRGRPGYSRFVFRPLKPGSGGGVSKDKAFPRGLR